MVVKKAWCLLDFSSYQGAAAFGNQTPNPTTCLGQMRAGREPPISPGAFGEEVRAGVASGELAFTAQADQEFVIGQYEKGLVAAVNRIAAEKDQTYRALSFQNLGWGDQQAAKLLEFVSYAAAHCTFPHGPIAVKCEIGNHISKDMAAKLGGFKGKFTL
uniref:Uncharacterized protein n=2 Tax=Alexandrium monilatum TaxID=311494 RepID=A0A7S4RJ34_9DINO